MNKSKFPCGDSTHTKKNGKRNGKQVYKCLDCDYQFRRKQRPSEEEIWNIYQRINQRNLTTHHCYTPNLY